MLRGLQLRSNLGISDMTGSRYEPDLCVGKSTCSYTVRKTSEAFYTRHPIVLHWNICNAAETVHAHLCMEVIQVRMGEIHLDNYLECENPF